MADLLQAIAHFGQMEMLIEGERELSIERSCVVLEKRIIGAFGTYEFFPWEPLAPATIARKGADTPLVETGELRDSIAHNSDENEGYVGTDNEKAKWHEFGTAAIPARPFLGGAITACEDEIMEMIGHHIKLAIEGG